ncbi:regulatory LuxR family protein [Alteromonadaceae bacterium 2753L.S.0a.02]|nr:regulatory LuxR family protein [Alteromonadaceae bacterium 2753L.S.0a.02]
MKDFIDRRTQIRAILAIVIGIVWFITLDLLDEPDSSALQIAVNLLEELPLVLTTVGTVILLQVTRKQRDEHLQVIRDLEVARIQGHRWRDEARAHLTELGHAIEEQFSRWNLTEAEREVALLLLKGLTSKEVAAVRATSERTVREQARSLYYKAGLSGRAALSAFFLEDLLAPIEGVGPTTQD